MFAAVPKIPWRVARKLHVAPRGLALAAILAVAVCATGAAFGADPAVRVIAQALTVADAGDKYPLTAPAAATRLPDDWSLTRPEHDAVVWYRIRFDPPGASAPHSSQSLYIERACSQIEVQLNGQLIYSTRSSVGSVANHCARPHLMTLPASALLPSGNVIDLRLQGHALQRVAGPARAAGLSVLKIGPSEVLAAEHARREFWNVSVVQALSIVLAALGFAVLRLDSWNRRNSHLRPYGWLALCGSALALHHWLGEAPVSSASVEFIVAAAVAPLAAASMLFLLRLAGRRWRQIEKLLLPQCLLMPLTLLLAGPSRLFLAASIWNTVLGLELLAVIGRTLWLTRRQPPHEYWPMAAALVTLATALALEFAVQRAWVAPPALETTQLILIALAIGLGLRLLRGFAKALQAAELGRRQLPGRALELAAAAERKFSQMADARIEQVMAQERKRIAADLHDDLGAKLLTIVHTSDSQRISTLAREALEEMRLSVRGLTGRPMQLADALADWRAEVMARLGQANIETDWRGPDEDVEQTLPARSFVQTTRILRESVSNIIKHSGATNCKVRCTVRDGEFELIVQDNGCGIPMELDGKLDRGHGMASMKHRAKQMRGQCLVESAPSYGTVIRLTLAL
jgi:signal transduction histidine kinase